jgi:hypothetical protein
MNATFKAYSGVLSDGWSGVDFRRCNNALESRKDFYVYAHYDPKEPVFCKSIPGLEIPFYVGLGVDARFCSNVRSREHARLMWRFTHDGFRNTEIGKIIMSGLDYRAACVLEAKLIVFWGCKDLDGPCLSGLESCLFNKQYEPHPECYGPNGMENEDVK